MSKFITLTTEYFNPIIQVINIADMIPNQRGKTIVELNSGKQYHVTETEEQIRGMIDDDE